MSRCLQKGFSFIEIMVAMTILSISLIVLMESQARSMDLITRARSLNKATTLAVNKMSELKKIIALKGITSFRDEEAGTFDEERDPGFRWRYWNAPVPVPDFSSMMASMGKTEEQEDTDTPNNEALLGGPLKGIMEVWGKAIRELHVEVIWGQGRQERSYELVTHFVLPDALSQMQGALGAMGMGDGSQTPD